MFGKHVSDILDLYLDYINPSTQKKSLKRKQVTQFRKWAKDLKRHFTKEDRHEKMLNIMWD